jgi:DEAD/DEAH box helicase domain-containing protein
VFIYDGMPGGAGLARAAFHQAEELFGHARLVMADCPCELGCPACVHSPKCGSGNRPIDKEGALRLLELMLEENAANVADAEKMLAAPLRGLDGKPLGAAPIRAPASCQVEVGAPSEVPQNARPAAELASPSRPEPLPPQDYVVLDVETRHAAAEVGGWNRADRMGVSLAVLYDSRSDAFTGYSQERVPELAAALAAAPLVVGFNLLRFDYAVLEPHAPGFKFRALPTLDLLQKVHEQLSYRLSLDNLARTTLNAPKSADGLMALQWWKEGKLEEIEKYCRRDVDLTRQLYLFGRENGYLLFTNKAGQAVRVRTHW